MNRRLLALGRVSFVDRTRGVNETRPVGLLMHANDIGAVIPLGRCRRC